MIIDPRRIFYDRDFGSAWARVRSEIWEIQKRWVLFSGKGWEGFVYKGTLFSLFPETTVDFGG